jgi:NADH:ubiquinone oxidoreductase subunit E
MTSPLTAAVCTGRSCSERMSSYILLRLQREFVNKENEAIITTCLCQGKCAEGPTLTINGEITTRHNPISASEELKRRIKKAKFLISHPS